MLNRLNMSSIPPSPLRENPYPQTAPQAPQVTFAPARYPVPHPYGPGGAYANPAYGAANPADRSRGRKVRVAFVAALLFIALSHNAVYRLADMIYAAFTSRPNELFGELGCPTLKGVVVNAAVFAFAILYIL